MKTTKINHDFTLYVTINSNKFDLDSYIKKLLATQDLLEWKNRPIEFNEWFKKRIQQIIDNMVFYIN